MRISSVGWLTLALITFFLPHAPARADFLWGSFTSAADTELTLLIDRSGKKVYMQTSGPSSQWFAWGFGSPTMEGYAIVFNSGATLGNYFETTMSYAVQPSPQSSQNVSATFTNISGKIIYTVTRDLVTGDSQDYSNWTEGMNDLTWAIGDKPFNMHSSRSAETFNIANAGDTKISAASHNHNGGSTTLTITNLPITLTNKIEFTSDLGVTNWTTVSNLIFSPSPDGSSLPYLLTNLTVSVATGNTNAQGFYRIRR